MDSTASVTYGIASASRVTVEPRFPHAAFPRSAIPVTSSSAFPSYISGVHHFWVRFFAYVTVFCFFLSNHEGSHIPSSWMVHAGCVFVAGIHPSRTWTSGSFESVWWNACVHRLDLGLYSHPKEFLGGMEFEPMLTPREKSPLPKNSPEEDRTRDAVDSEPKHYQRAIPAPASDFKTGSLVANLTSALCYRASNVIGLVSVCCD